MRDAPDNHTGSTAEQSHGAVVLRSLPPGELIELLNKLRLFAARRYYGQLNVDDLVMQAVTDTLEGKRNWNANFPPFQNLCLIIRSIASNQLQKERLLRPYDPDAEAGTDQSAPLPSAHLSPVEIHETNETQRGLRGVLLRAVDGDRLLGRMVRVFFEQEVWKPKEMASALDVSEPEIYKANRRLKRRLEKLLNKS